jgi:hypothetical protein
VVQRAINARVVTFGTGMTVRERLVDIDDTQSVGECLGGA